MKSNRTVRPRESAALLRLRRQWERIAHRERHRLAALTGWVCEYCLEGLQCARCGEHDDYGPDMDSERSVATVDHIIALTQGGTNDPANLILACGRCNSSKGKRPGMTIAEEMGWWPYGQTGSGAP